MLVKNAIALLCLFFIAVMKLQTAYYLYPIIARSDYWKKYDSFLFSFQEFFSNKKNFFYDKLKIFFTIHQLPQAEACKKKAAAPPPPGVLKDAIKTSENQLSEKEAQLQSLKNSQRAQDEAPLQEKTQQRNKQRNSQTSQNAASLSERELVKQIEQLKEKIKKLKELLVRSEAYQKAREAKQARRRGKNQPVILFKD